MRPLSPTIKAFRETDRACKPFYCFLCLCSAGFNRLESLFRLSFYRLETFLDLSLPFDFQFDDILLKRYAQLFIFSN